MGHPERTNPAPETTGNGEMQSNHLSLYQRQGAVPVPNPSHEHCNAILTRITSTRPGTLTKCYSLGDDGQLKKSVAANLVSGVADTGSVCSATDLSDMLTELKPNQALAFGVVGDTQPKDRTNLYSRGEYEKQGRPADATTRTKDVFTWPDGPGVLLIDYDPQEGKPPLSRQELLGALTGVIPELANSAYVWWPSSSSLIYREQDQLAGMKGQRVYMLVQDATDIPRAGQVLFDRLWLAGYGHYEVSRAGSKLERCLVDNSVWQTNRLDFAAGAKCAPPLEQRRGEPEVQEGLPLDTQAALPDLTADEQAQLAAFKSKAKDDVQVEADDARQLYIKETAAELVQQKHGSDLKGEELDRALEQARHTVERAAQQGVLAGDFTITLADKQSVTIGEMLDNPAEYHGRLTLDPLEPEYCGSKVVGKLYLIGGRPNLYSFAHGGRNFKLIRQPRRIEHQQGLMADTTGKTLEYLRRLPDVFDMGSELVQVQDGRARHLSIHSLAFWLGGVAQFWQWGKTPNGAFYEKLIDPPAQVLNQLLAVGDTRHLKPLKSVINSPVIDKDGDVQNRVGYNSKTQLYLDMPDDPPTVPTFVDENEALQALDTLMAPFSDFCVAGAQDRGVLMAAVLTAIQRPVLETAPAVGLDAPTQGTGKSYLAQCLGLLATGASPSVYPHTAGRDDEETRKRLTSILSEGSRVIVWDNVLGHFDSAALAAFITSSTYSDRILKKSEVATFPNRALLLITGNNLTLAGDMPRRVLKCRLDAGVANPALRRFDGNPLAYIAEHRQELVQAALTLIRGYMQSDVYAFGGAVPDETTASFEQWDALVRQPVAWVAQLRSDQYADPAEALKDAVATDPEKEELAELLQGLKAVMGGDWFDTKELFNRIDEFSTLAAGERGELRDLLASLCNGRLTTKGAGRVLGYRVDRIAGGLRLKERSRRVRKQYRVDVVTCDTAADADTYRAATSGV